jgi:hypothetical protein
VVLFVSVINIISKKEILTNESKKKCELKKKGVNKKLYKVISDKIKSKASSQFKEFSNQIKSLSM